MNGKKIGMIMALVVSMAAGAQAEGWSISAGPQLRAGMKMDLMGSAYANRQGGAYLPGQGGHSAYNWRYAPRPDISVIKPPSDDITQYANRTFDDGYVNISTPTEPTGYTWYWGFEDAAQYNSQLQTLTFTRESSVSDSGYYSDDGSRSERSVERGVLEDREASDSEKFSGWGVQVEAAKTLARKDHLTLDLVAGLGALWGQGVTLEDQTYAAYSTQRRYDRFERNTYAYDLQAQYDETYVYNDPEGAAGSVTPPYAGGEEGPGPTIPELPATRDVVQSGVVIQEGQLVSQESVRELTGTTTWNAQNQVSVDADVNFYSLRLGPRAGITMKDAVRLFVQPQLSANLVTADLTRKEELYLTGPGGAQTAAAWRDEETEQKWVAGLGLAAGGGLDLKNGYFVEAALGYEWMLDKPSFDVGPSTVKVDLSGFQGSASLGKRF